mmetsp:Transcript_39775/g.76046  ORF Transcript_39775/g.76046 Transcript_39775/m.76046 type:complete len:173 (-) Transcript_39775:1072-1590(-)
MVHRHCTPGRNPFITWVCSLVDEMTMVPDTAPAGSCPGVSICIRVGSGVLAATQAQGMVVPASVTLTTKVPEVGPTSVNFGYPRRNPGYPGGRGGGMAIGGGDGGLGGGGLGEGGGGLGGEGLGKGGGLGGGGGGGAGGGEGFGGGLRGGDFDGIPGGNVQGGGVELPGLGI